MKQFKKLDWWLWKIKNPNKYIPIECMADKPENCTRKTNCSCCQD